MNGEIVQKIREALRRYYRWRVRLRWSNADLYSWKGGAQWDGMLYDQASANWTHTQHPFFRPYSPAQEWRGWRDALRNKHAPPRYAAPYFGIRGQLTYWSANILIYTPWALFVLEYWAVDPTYNIVQSGLDVQFRKAPGRFLQGVGRRRIKRHGVAHPRYCMSVNPFNFVQPEKGNEQ